MKFLFLLLAFVLPTQAQFMQAIPAKTATNCEQRADIMQKWLLDWPDLARYRQADLDSAPSTRRVVFMGDSITDAWNLAASFPSRPYVNRGISGQTTSQMLLRFQQDVANLHPAAVVILAGTNDIAGNTGAATLEEIENNFSAMAAIARANNIRVIIISVTPVNDYTERAHRFFAERSMDKIRALNGWLNDFAARNHYAYVDCFTPMLDQRGFLKRELAEDGLHPNAAGYALMAKLLEPAIENATAHSAATKKNADPR